MNKQLNFQCFYSKKVLFQILFIVLVLLNSISSVFSQEEINKKKQRLKKVFITETYTYSYDSHDNYHYFREKIDYNNSPFGNTKLGLHYHLHFPNHIELLSNISYTYEKDFGTYIGHFMDEMGSSEVHIKNHLISLDVGVKVFIPRKWNRLYLRLSTSVSYSLYRRNDFYIPGQYHYQEFKKPTFSSISLISGIGFDIPIYSNHFINLEFGHITPYVGYYNPIYSYFWYAQIGYGFTF